MRARFASKSLAAALALAALLACPARVDAQVPVGKLYAGRNDEVRDITAGGNVAPGLAFSYGLPSVNARTPIQSPASSTIARSRRPISALARA